MAVSPFSGVDGVLIDGNADLFPDPPDECHSVSINAFVPAEDMYAYFA